MKLRQMKQHHHYYSFKLIQMPLNMPSNNVEVFIPIKFILKYHIQKSNHLEYKVLIHQQITWSYLLDKIFSALYQIETQAIEFQHKTLLLSLLEFEIYCLNRHAITFKSFTEYFILHDFSIVI